MPPSRFVVYCRISSDEAKRGENVAMHLAECHEFTAEHGGEIIAEFADNDESASDWARPGERPDYDRCLEWVTAHAEGEPFGILTTNAARVTRHPRDHESLVDLAEVVPALKGLATTSEQWWALDSAPGVNALRKEIVSGAEYAATVSVNVRRACKKQARKGGYWGRRPFGYDVCWRNAETLEIVCDSRPVEAKDRVGLIRSLKPRADEAAEIVAAAELLAQRHPLRPIVLDWDRRDVRTTMGEQWDQTDLSRMLRDARNIGVREHRRAGWRQKATRDTPATTYVASWPAILSQDVYAAMCAHLNDPARVTTSGRGRVHLLSGFLYCAVCGAKMRGGGSNGQRGNLRYTCPPDPTGHGCVNAQAKGIDAWISRVVLHWAQEGGAVEQALARLSGEDETVKRLSRERLTVEAKLARYSADYDAGYLRGSDWAPRRDACEREIEQLTRKITRVKPPPAPHGDTLAAQWQEWEAGETFGLEQRRVVIGAYIDHVKVHPTARGRLDFDPGRVTIVARPWLAEHADAELLTLPTPEIRRTVREQTMAFLKEHAEEEITKPQIAAGIGLTDYGHGHTTIENVLRDLTKRGIVTKVHQGMGRRPSRYIYRPEAEDARGTVRELSGPVEPRRGEGIPA